ncbi:MAG: hypothetical protein WC613_03075 [Candidatus Aenigmatarchaeota archaeon]
MLLSKIKAMKMAVGAMPIAGICQCPAIILNILLAEREYCVLLSAGESEAIFLNAHPFIASDINFQTYYDVSAIHG